MLSANSSELLTPSEDVLPVEALQPLLRELHAAARRAWPTVALTPEQFAGHLRARLPAEGDAAAALRALHTDDLYLACGCALGDTRALAAFEDDVLSVVDRALPLVRAEPHVIDEVKQQLRLIILVGERGAPKIAEFAGRGSLRNWVRVMAVRAALHLMREAERHRPTESDALERALPPAGSPELDYLKRRYRGAFEQAFRVALRALSPRERTLLRHRFIDELSIDEIGALYRVHRATAARWVERAAQALQARTRAALLEQVMVTATELDSIIRLVRSQLKVTLRTLYRNQRPKPATSTPRTR
jgi:RNA polymerase sigma-70 factor (ECF subfamily)